MELQPLIDLLDYAKVKATGTNNIEIRLKKNLSEEAYQKLDEEPFSIEKHTSSNKINKTLSTTTTAAKGDIIFLAVPRKLSGCVVAKDLNDLLSINGAFQRQPTEMLLLKVTNSERASYWTGRNNKPQIIQAYEAAVELASLLIAKSDHKSPTQSWVTFFDVHKLKIDLTFTAQDLQWVFPYKEVNDFLNEPNLDTERMEVFRSTLWSLLRDVNEGTRCASLLSMGANFTMHLRHNLAIIRQNYTLERRIQTARSEASEIADKVNKTLLGIEAKALAVPALAIVAINKVEVGFGFAKTNLALYLTSLLFSVIMWLGYYSLRDYLRSLSKNIDDCENKLLYGLELKKSDNLPEIFDTLKNRINKSRIAKQLVAWASVIVLLIILYQGFNSTKSTTKTDTKIPPAIQNIE